MGNIKFAFLAALSLVTIQSVDVTLKNSTGFVIYIKSGNYGENLCPEKLLNIVAHDDDIITLTNNNFEDECHVFAAKEGFLDLICDNPYRHASFKVDLFKDYLLCATSDGFRLEIKTNKRKFTEVGR